MSKVLLIFISFFLFPAVTSAQTPFESKAQASNGFPEIRPTGTDLPLPAFNGETPLKPVKPFAKKPKRPMPPPYKPAERFSSLDGKAVGFLVNSHPAAQDLLLKISDNLKKRHPNLDVRFMTYEENTDIIDSPQKNEFFVWLQSVNAVVTGIADNAPIRSEQTPIPTHIERNGRPTVLVAESPYLKKINQDEKHPLHQRIRAVGTELSETDAPAINRLTDEIEKALTQPLSDKEKESFKSLPEIDLPDAMPDFRERFEQEWSLQLSEESKTAQLSEKTELPAFSK